MAWKRKQAPNMAQSSYARGRQCSVALRRDEAVLKEHSFAPLAPATERWTSRKQRTLEQSIENVFCYLCLSDEQTAARGALHSPDVTPTKFREPECLIGAELPRESTSDVAYFMDATPRDLPSYYDVSVCSERQFEDEDGAQRNAVCLHRLRPVPLRRARGSKLSSPYLAEFSQCAIWLDTGEYSGAKWLLNWGKSKWRDLGQTAPNPGQDEFFLFRSLDPEQDQANYRVLMGVEFTRDLVWRVVLKSHHGAELSLPTGYAGAMAAFRNREPNDVTGRRDALRHWVSEHYRSRSDEDDEREAIHVRQHLRGRTPFRWLGLDCELVVAPFDERRNERIKAAKEASRRR